jgi:hypothetical protein
VGTRRLSLVPLGLVLVALGFRAGDAAACACCADAWEYGRDTEPLAAEVREQLAPVELTGDLGLAGVGEREPALAFGPYAVGGRFEAGGLRLAVGAPDGKRGQLTFRFDEPADSFFSDLRLLLPPAEYTKLMGSPPHETRLYKELRLRGALEASGPLFTGPGVGVSRHAELVLHGIGNHCPDPADYHGWALRFTLIRAGEREEGLARGGVSLPTKSTP